MTPLLQARDLSKEFRSLRSLLSRLRGEPPWVLRALDHVSLDVSAGETLGIVGESGCGKSTLARCLVRLQSLSEGTILFKGQNVTALKGEDLRNFHGDVQMIFQDPVGSLNPRLAAGRALAEVLKVHGRGEG